MVAEVVNPPDRNTASKIFEEERDYWINKKDWEEKKKVPSIWIKYERFLLDNPLKHYELEAIDELKNLHILRCPRGMVFKVSDHEGKIIEILTEIKEVLPRYKLVPINS